MKQKRNFIIFLVMTIFLIPCMAICDTNVSGNQSGTWLLTNSPYFVIGDVTIPTGNSLVIEPGVLVEVQGNYRITAEGYITAQGTISDSIKFYGLGTTTWEGIRLEDETNQSTFDYCRISNTDGTNGYGIHSVNAQVIIQGSYFYDHRKAVHFSAISDDNPSYMEISDSKISTCEQCGILITENSNVLVDNCEIIQCGQGTSYWPGIQLSLQTSSGECNPTLTNNHIHHNGKQGITMANMYNYGEMAPHVENNVVEYNLTGVYLYNAQGYYKNNDIRYNFISGNPNSGAGVMLYGSGTNGTFVQNEVAFNFCGFYCINNATSNLGDLGNFNANDDGENNIHDNIDESGTTYSVYNMSALDMKAENNSWDSDNFIEISETIIDGNDNPSYGIVDFDPIYSGVALDPQAEMSVCKINGNSPNPFTRSTTISFTLESQAHVSIEIF
ncbi:MAG TPA: right-handed parallel beta-helix repeat-containing protein, partial [Bacteroidetes bacterium]|nr:right-handed parallel beta-helix repeat-containing protein [Bacteroidota bacterium]